jgi:hypothetical protein
MFRIYLQISQILAKYAGYRSGGNLAIGAAVGLVPAAALKLILGAIMIISAVRIFRK